MLGPAVVAKGPEFTSEDTDTDEPGRYYYVGTTWGLDPCGSWHNPDDLPDLPYGAADRNPGRIGGPGIGLLPRWRAPILG
jgi:hypothetical protein